MNGSFLLHPSQDLPPLSALNVSVNFPSNNSLDFARPRPIRFALSIIAGARPTCGLCTKGDWLSPTLLTTEPGPPSS